MKLAEAKQRLSIHALWRHFGFEREPSKSCRCPFHKDKSASFSVTSDGGLWNCFAGCGGGDAVDFFILASGLPHSEGCRAFIALAGGSPVASAPRLPRAKPGNAATVKAAQRKTWPPFESPLTGADATPSRATGALAKLRHVSVEGVRLMATRGLLHFAVWKDSPAWIVSDAGRMNAQARQMDGKPWPGIDAKAQTLPGSRAAWPIGARESRPFCVVLFCEGGPDLLAAHHFIHAHGREGDTFAVGMLGASNIIPADALPLFSAKRIRIMAHTDEAGHQAAANWAEQLGSVTEKIDAADFAGLLMADGTPIKDLNDCTRIRPEDAHELETLIPNEDLEP